MSKTFFSLHTTKRKFYMSKKLQDNKSITNHMKVLLGYNISLNMILNK